jgi:multicomponent Na+:H+ antiporter subunit F
MESMYDAALTAALVIVGLGIFVLLFRAVKGPSTADRIISINMTGTATITLILLLTLLWKESYLADIALIYALLSFLAVVLLVRIFVALNRKRGGEDGRDA